MTINVIYKNKLFKKYIKTTKNNKQNNSSRTISHLQQYSQ